MLGDEMNQKVYAVTVRSTEMGFNLVQAAIKAVLNRDKTQSIGKQSIKDLNKQGIQLDNHAISSQDLKLFERELRRFGIDYAIQKEHSKPDTYNVYFKARDILQIEDALGSYTKKILVKQEKPSIADRIKLAVMKAQTQTLDVAKERNLEHGAR